MTESEWLVSTDPVAMFASIVDRVSERRARLVALACWSHCTYYRKSPRAILKAYADCERGYRSAMPVGATLAGIDEVLNFAAQCDDCYSYPDISHPSLQFLKPSLIRDVLDGLWRPVQLCGDHRSEAVRTHCPTCDRFRSPTVMALAHAAYDNILDSGDLELDRLCVLADALEEAGCVGEQCGECYGSGTYYRLPPTFDMRRLLPVKKEFCRECGGTGSLPHPLLAHLRSPGPHVRGCWAVDRVLGRE